MKTFPTSAVWCFGILFISVSLLTTGLSEVQVVGPADPVVALAGDDIILPCSLKPNVSAEDMTVEWTGLYLTTRNVHLYRDGRDSNEEQFPSYRGRTSMFHEELKNGNVSLKLNRVTLSDAGSYRCFIPTLMKDTTVQLFVGAVSQPVISIDGTKGWGVVLKCESGGWFPEPEMEWLDSSGTILPADGPPERHRDSEGHYTVRQHVTVDKTDTNRFTCRVHQTEINHLKETEIHVPDDVFPKSQVGLIVGLIAAAVIVLLAAPAGVYMWRKHTEKKIRKLLEEQGDAQFVDIHSVHLSQRVTMVIPMAFYLIRSERYSEIHAARTRQDQMRRLYQALNSREDSGGNQVKSDFYRILLDLEPDVVYHLGANFVDVHKYQLIQKVTKVMPILHELFYKELYCNIRIHQMTRRDQMRQLYKALEEADDSRSVKLDFYRILLDLEPDVVYHLGSNEEDRYLYVLIQNLSRQMEVRIQSGSNEEDRYLYVLIQNLSRQMEVRIQSDELQNLAEQMEDVRIKSDSNEEDLYLYELQNLAEQMEVRIQSGDAQFVDIHSVHLSQRVTMVIPMAFYLIRSERYSEIHAARTRQDQMRLLYEALNSRGDSGGNQVKSDFYRILLDLEPDVVNDLGSSACSNWTEDNDLYELNTNLTGQLDNVTRERDGLKEELIELNEKLRKAKETIQSLSTSPGGQQETQTPSQKSERIEGMEMKSFPGRKSAPEMESLLGPGLQNDLEEMERGGRVTIDNNSML
ncbi:uncharacterized protein LOC110535267 isoform X2 [Oncorhynchus mykiss]|uniref:uncharacterized protein LOC110535267 isoform X2 n=1 Tax=Oncorhynchus mykiss TaxID=8022 RepID=UPI001877A529|nr:uncharacterized protein LOC110535267 isoform X2 [Oncorhynchus mykiss]